MSATLRKVLTPSSKKRANVALSKLRSKKDRLNRTVRRELGINLSKKVQVAVAEPLEIENKAHAFFARDDISRVCPYTRKVSKGVSIRQGMLLAITQPCVMCPVCLYASL